MALRFHQFPNQHNCLCGQYGHLVHFYTEKDRAHSESLRFGGIRTEEAKFCHNVHWKGHMEWDLHLFLIGKIIFDV